MKWDTCFNAQVELDPVKLSTFFCAEEHVAYMYKYRNMQAAFCNIPPSKNARDISTKVSLLSCKYAQSKLQ